MAIDRNDIVIKELTKEDVETLLNNRHPNAHKPNEVKISEIEDLIMRGQWNGECNDEILIDKEGRVHNGIQRLEAMRRVQQKYPYKTFPATLRLNTEPNQHNNTATEWDLESRTALTKGGIFYGKPWQNLLTFLYKNIEDKSQRTNKSKFFARRSRRSSLTPDDYVMVTETNHGYYEGWQEFYFANGMIISKLYFRAALFLLYISGYWETSHVKRILDVLTNDSDLPEDQVLINHRKAAETATGVFRPENLNVENSNIGTFKLMRKNLSVFIKYLDELENKPKKERMSEAQIDSFIFDQIKKFFAPMEKERERQREAYARQCASLM